MAICSELNFPDLNITKLFGLNTYRPFILKLLYNMFPCLHRILFIEFMRQRIGSLFRLSKEHTSKPYVKGPHDVLVKVKAASVNPMDVAMTSE